MSYELGADEPVREAIARCAREQIEKAIKELTEGTNEDPVRAVHDARKAIKRERSLLRLARGAVPARQRREENEALRDAARALSDTRDADVLVATLDGLAAHFAGQLPASTFDAIHDQLESRRARVDGATNGAALYVGAAEQLRAIGRRLDDWELAGDGWPALRDGLLVSYTRGRKAFARARRSDSPEAIHSWRKRVKDIWYQARLLAPACGPTVDGLANDAHRLADLLGDAHDLDLLREDLTGGAMIAPVDVEAVVRLLDLRRAELRAQALRLGGRIYAESPKAFRRRMKRLWSAGRSLALASHERDPREIAAATRKA